MNPRASAEKAADWIARAAREDVGLVVFPEVFVPGFPYWINLYPPLVQAGLNRAYQDASVDPLGPALEPVRDAARDGGVTVVLGISERSGAGRTCYNTAVIVDHRGEVLLSHRKLQPTYAERYIWGRGDGSTLAVVPTATGRLGALACWEHTMNLARQALIEQQMEVHAGLWPGLSTLAGFTETANVQIEAMMVNHAVTGQCFVVAASSPVTAEMLDYMSDALGGQELMSAGGGWSAVIHPFGSALAGPVTGLDEQLVIADIDLDDIADVKLWVDGTGHYARPEVLRLWFDCRAQPTVQGPEER
jgi:predicted amidohydrolase